MCCASSIFPTNRPLFRLDPIRVGDETTGTRDSDLFKAWRSDWPVVDIRQSKFRIAGHPQKTGI